MELESKPFDLKKCVEESLDLVAASTAEKNLEIVCIFGDELPDTVIGDVIRLRQILVNLLGNAVKFTEIGEVEISVGSRDLENGKIELEFAIRDTGIGISGERMDRLFQSFSQVDSSTTRQYGGTGLGLAISKRFAEMMGGRIWAESERGMGSTFHFTIATKLSASRDAIPINPILAGKRIVIVYKNDLARRMLADAVRSWGMIPVVAFDRKSAMEILCSVSESFDFMILDAALGNEDVLFLSWEAKRGSNAKAPYVIFATIGCTISRETQFDGWLTKPVKPTQLYSLLAELLLPKRDAGPINICNRPKNGNIGRHDLRILVAEDNPVNLKVALSMLKRIGYSADVAANGIEVLNALVRQHYDVVLMDVQMPEMDGFEATRRIRSSGFNTRIIAVTANALNGDKEACLSEGMDGYISKSIRMEELQEALEKII
jgi:CheY-like chemotaxis protein